MVSNVTDKVAAALAGMRERNDQWIASMALTEASVNDSPFGDLRRALAAVEAVLALHPADKDEDYPREQPLCPACSEWWPCDTIRAVSRALLGEEPSPAGHGEDLVDMGVLELGESRDA